MPPSRRVPPPFLYTLPREAPAARRDRRRRGRSYTKQPAAWRRTRKKQNTTIPWTPTPHQTHTIRACPANTDIPRTPHHLFGAAPVSPSPHTRQYCHPFLHPPCFPPPPIHGGRQPATTRPRPSHPPHTRRTPGPPHLAVAAAAGAPPAGACAASSSRRRPIKLSSAASSSQSSCHSRSAAPSVVAAASTQPVRAQKHRKKKTGGWAGGRDKGRRDKELVVDPDSTHGRIAACPRTDGMDAVPYSLDR